MTANPTVPSDVWAWQQPGVPFVAAIVEGELETGFYFGPDRFTPPAWLVALRDARCGNISTHRVSPGQCTDCVGGRLLHDVRVEDPDGEHDGYTECRTVRCMVDLAGVVGSWPQVVGPVQLFVVDGRVWLVVDGQDARQLTPAHVDALAAACGKPPADWPGGYAVVLTEVGE